MLRLLLSLVTGVWRPADHKIGPSRSPPDPKHGCGKSRAHYATPVISFVQLFPTHDLFRFYTSTRVLKGAILVTVTLFPEIGNEMLDETTEAVSLHCV